MKSEYRRLTNWGDTCPLVCLIGKIKNRSFSDEGHCELWPFVDNDRSIDRRLASGYCYAKAICLPKVHLEKAELLELFLNQKKEC